MRREEADRKFGGCAFGSHLAKRKKSWTGGQGTLGQVFQNCY
jgi:hypothetical protein